MIVEALIQSELQHDLESVICSRQYPFDFLEVFNQSRIQESMITFE